MQNKVPVYERLFYKVAFCSHLIITVIQLDHTLIKFTHVNFTNRVITPISCFIRVAILDRNIALQSVEIISM